MRRFCEADELKEWGRKSWTKRCQSQCKLNVQTGRRASLVEEQSCIEFGGSCWFLRGNQQTVSRTFDADRMCDQVSKNDALKRTGVLDS